MKKSKINSALIEKILKTSEQYAKVSQNNKEIAKKWIIIADDDLLIAEKLFGLEYYPSAVYHLQQGFEKLLKGYYIYSGRMTPEQMLNTHRFIIERLKKEVKEEVIKDLTELSSLISDKKIDLSFSELVLKNIEKSDEMLRKMSLKEIQSILIFLHNIEINLKSEESIKNLEKKANEKGFLKMLKFVVFKITKFRVRDSQIQEAVEECKLIEYLDNITLGINLHYLSLITFLHYNCPRYPSIKDSEINFFSYNKSLGIVEDFQELINFSKEISLKIKKLYK